jgi:meso-butanediol dehydrogenase/(S,S)-butanediol dehydrogenase/diacetyl reductase|tara:strand:+ start:41886 stop:42656 length:771 start_codon:yes stop_codon:yes gene_type:complete
MRFRGKTVIVTGSSSGIGEEIARRFAEEGANVTLNSRSRERLERVAANLEDDRTLIVEGDAGERESCDRIVAETVNRFGALDILINNAGAAVAGPLEDASDEDIDKVISLNVRGVLYLCRAAIPHLKKSGGSIVNISSVSGSGGDWTMPIYNASKGAVTNLTRSLALGLGKDGVRVNAVLPSLTRTELSADLMEQEELVDKFKARIALGRVAEPDDIAGPVLFLASDEAKFVTGVNLPVDGGVSASNGQPNLQRAE